MRALGQFSLNISNIPERVLPDYTKLIYEVIESILPASHYFPMTLDNMNTLQFVPKKDYKTNKLTSGLLQLAPHTHLILDETRLAIGKLEAAGIEAVKNLSQLINSQQIRYNFEYYELEFDADIPILVLSEGRSMLPTNCQIPMMANETSLGLMKETFEAVRHFLRPKLNGIRKYLTQQRLAEFNIKSEDPDMIQNDFVTMRKENPKFNADDLHLMLSITRLFGLAQGKGELTRELWEKTKELEGIRKERIEAVSAKRNEP